MVLPVVNWGDLVTARRKSRFVGGPQMTDRASTAWMSSTACALLEACWMILARRGSNGTLVSTSGKNESLHDTHHNLG